MDSHGSLRGAREGLAWRRISSWLLLSAKSWAEVPRVQLTGPGWMPQWLICWDSASGSWRLQRPRT